MNDKGHVTSCSLCIRMDKFRKLQRIAEKMGLSTRGSGHTILIRMIVTEWLNNYKEEE